MSVVAPVELACAAVLGLYVAAAGSGRAALADVLLLGAGAWVGEEICIRGYHAYAYAPAWHLFLDRLPLAVLLTWPAVILSGRAVAKLLSGAIAARGRGGEALPSSPEEAIPVRAHLPIALWTGLVVWFDASLVEPVATHAGLWHWNLPGPFSVPLVGPLGWGFYAAAGVWCLDRLRGGWRLATVLLAPALAHLLILASWWGALRWVAAPWPESVALVAGLGFCGVATLVALRARRGGRLAWREAVPRAGAAAVFFALLGVRPDAALALFALAFAPPWLALLPSPARPR